MRTMVNLRRWPVATLLLGASVLLAGCGNAAHAPPAGALQDVRSIEIHYRHAGAEQVDEVHRLRPGPGRRTFRRSSQWGVAGAGPALTDDVPAQRVAELLWAVSAPAWSRERGVDEVARRVRPAQMLERVSLSRPSTHPGCTPHALQGQLRTQLRGQALRTQMDRYFSGGWSDDDASIRVVIDYESAPEQVISSRAQTLLMLPWVLGQAPLQAPASANADPAPDPAPRTWSVPISQALRRVLPPTSNAYVRLGQREDDALQAQLIQSAQAACKAQQR